MSFEDEASERSVLYLAAALGDLELCKYLLDHHADVNEVRWNMDQ